VAERAKAYIGTSGWNYKHWRNEIYPPKLPQSKWLAYLCEHFNTVELNTSFYRIPKPESVQTWNSIVPPDFRFAVKLWRGITHYKKLKNAGTFIASFLEVIEHFDAKHRGPVLVQLPPNQGKDIAKLEAFIDEWRELDSSHWKLAFEFRNAAWLTQDVYDLLDRKRAALCIHDMMHAGAVDRPNDGSDFVYVRRHGSGEGRYAGSYSPEQIERDARKVRTWLNAGRSVFVYYNNDIGGHAFRNAIDLRRLVEGTPER
jgi:uncharacterized protein YecE (DUF72 family)